MTDVSTTVNAITVTDAGTAVTVDIGTWPAAHAATHGAAGYDPVTVAQSQVTGLTTDLALKAPLASPTFTGTPAAPTAAADTNTTQVATTAFVVAQAGTATPVVNGTGTVGTSLRYSRQDHIHPTDTSRAPTASPTFTGVVAVPAGSASAPSIVPDGDTNTGIYSPGADQVGISTAGTARVTVDASGNVAIPSANLAVGNTTPGNSIVVYNGNGVVDVQRYVASTTTGPTLITRKSASASVGTQAALVSGEVVGRLIFQGSDGTGFIDAASVRAEVDGTPGTNDMPGRLMFLTTPDGSATLTERMRIDNAGLITGTGTSLGAWSSTTPTLTAITTNPTLGSSGGTLIYYCQIGKTVHFTGYFAFGGTGVAAGSGVYSLSLPVTAKRAAYVVGNAFAWDASAATAQQAVVQLPTTTTMEFIYTGAIPSFRAAQPWTWADGDYCRFSGTYEAA